MTGQTTSVKEREASCSDDSPPSREPSPWHEDQAVAELRAMGVKRQLVKAE